jgi:glycosyltransferase involved in cell wall biosynthesis
MMRIVIVTPSYPSAECGISTYTGYLAAALRDKADVEIAGRAAGRSLVEDVAEAARHADLIHVQHAFGIYGYMGWRTIPLLLALKRTHHRIVTTIHELPSADESFNQRSPKERAAYAYLRAVLGVIARHSAVLIVHSEANRDRLRGLVGTAQSIEVIPHGVLDGIGAGYRAPHQPPVIGFFGFLAAHKGVHHLIAALTSVPQARLIIAGKARTPVDADYERSLRAQVEAAGLSNRVRFLGYVPDDRMAAFFEEIDLAVFPYHHSTASGALALALAHGCPAIASDIPVFRELAQRWGCIEIVDPSPQRLAGAIRHLLADESRRRALIHHAGQMLAEAGWGQVAKRHHELYVRMTALSPSATVEVAP